MGLSDQPENPKRHSHLGSSIRFAGILGLLLLLAACGGQGGGNTLTVVDAFEMDMYMPGGGTATATGPTLEAGRTYVMTISGTYSIWSDEWDGGVCKGTAEDEPMFPSPGSANGVVGIDAEFYYAVPNGSALCGMEIPRDTGDLDFSLDGGVTFDHPDPTPPVSQPTPDHTYSWELVGQGHPIMFSRPDSPSDDNYGVLKITIATE